MADLDLWRKAAVANADLLTRARQGDDNAFRLLTDPYRRELLAHCYRMLGSVADAQDAVQETLLAAWQGLAGFGERASVRTWLAPDRDQPVPQCAAHHPTATGQGLGHPRCRPSPTHANRRDPVARPVPDSIRPASPADRSGRIRYEQTESMSLAFVAALQTLPPRQLAVLVLRACWASGRARWPTCWTPPCPR